MMAKGLFAVALLVAVAYASEVEMLSDDLELPPVSQFHCHGSGSDLSGAERLPYERVLRAALKAGTITEDQGRARMQAFGKQCDEFDKTQDSALTANYNEEKAVASEFATEAKELGADATTEAGMEMPPVDKVTCTKQGGHAYWSRMEDAAHAKFDKKISPDAKPTSKERATVMKAMQKQSKIDSVQAKKLMKAFQDACTAMQKKESLAQFKAEETRELGDSAEVSATVPTVTAENCSKERIAGLKASMQLATFGKAGAVEEEAKLHFGNFVAECQGFSNSESEPSELGEDSKAMSTEELLATATDMGLPDADAEHCSAPMLEHMQAGLQAAVKDNTLLLKDAHARMTIFSQLCEAAETPAAVSQQETNEQLAQTEDDAAEETAEKLLSRDHLGEDVSTSAMAVEMPAIDAAHCTEAVGHAYQAQMEAAKVSKVEGSAKSAAFGTACAAFMKAHPTLGDSAPDPAFVGEDPAEARKALAAGVKLDGQFGLTGGASRDNCAQKLAYRAALMIASEDTKKISEADAKMKYANFEAVCEGFPNK